MKGFQEIIDIGNYGKSFDNKMYEIANEYRIRYANQYAELYLSSNKQAIVDELIKDSFLEEIIERDPFDDCVDTITFTRFINKYIIDDILWSKQYSNIEKISIILYVIEMSAREFISPYKPSVIYKHLAAAKSRGYFFTPPSLAIRMVKKAIEKNKNASMILDPACGTGIFLAFYILLKPDTRKIVGIEIDKYTAKYANFVIQAIRDDVGAKTNIQILDIDFFDFYENNSALLFDTIIMNPPYGNLKFMTSDLLDVSTKSRLTDKEMNKLKNEIRTRTSQMSKKLKKQFAYSGLSKGVLELSKIFLAATINLLNKDGVIVAITPSTWLGDDNSSDFRKFLLRSNSIHELWNFDEIAKMFKGVNQPTTVSVIANSNYSGVKIYNHLKYIEELSNDIDIITSDEIIALGGSKIKIPKCSMQGVKTLEKLSNFSKLSNCYEVINARGELDLTSHKKYVTYEKCSHRLIRGDHIVGVKLLDPDRSDKAGYVAFDDFIIKCSDERKKHIFKERIAISQCSYLKKKKRIESCIIEPESIISNSCNFLVIKSEKENSEKLLYYYSWVNCSIVEWYFRTFSYNNHVANYELADLPVLNYDNISDKYKNMLLGFINIEKPEYSAWTEIDAFWAIIYNITFEEFKNILSDIKNEDSDIILDKFCEIERMLKSE